MYFALNWAILLPYYALNKLVQVPGLGKIAEFLPTYSAVLLLLTAGPLWTEAKIRDEGLNKTVQSRVHWIDSLAQRSLYLVALPHVVAFADVNYEPQTMVILHSIMLIAGFILISLGLRRLIKHHDSSWRSNVWIGFIAIALVYALADTYWSYELVSRGLDFPMPNWEKITLAGCKSVFSALFLILVVSEIHKDGETSSRIGAAA